MLVKTVRGTEASASGNSVDRLCRANHGPILKSRSRKDVSDQLSIAPGVASVRRKFAKV